MATQSISSEDFAFEILQILFDQRLTNDSFLILAEVIELAAEQNEAEIPDQLKSAAVNFIYAGHFVDTWEDPQNNRCVKINRAGMTQVQARTANRLAQKNAQPENRWLIPLILIVLAIGAAIFLLWRFRVFRR